MMVTVLMLVLVGAGALAVDIGRIAAYKAQLQNGADASALAVAAYCAKNKTSCTTAGASLANQYTPANSNGGTAVPASVTFPTSTSVRVVSSSPAGGLQLTLANALNINSQVVEAAATATWKPPSGDGGFPLALSDTCFDLASASNSGDLQKFSYKPGNGKNATSTNMECTRNASGQTVSGGWGWLKESDPCEATTSANGTIPSDPGNDPGDCKTILQDWISTLSQNKPVEVLFPVFSYADYQGNSAQYHILGYATLQIYAWQFSGTGSSPYTYMPGSIPAKVKCTGSERCVVGKFVRFVTTEAETGPGGKDYGSYAVALTQ
ncbi:pilus assembly protein TadG-related protein [Sinomonas atrocyanea]|uniref:pilus assembly protein TadG-related protein n=1 Tax=Sinomonas atrocyanea TaxID=37927 RepID=UPI003D96AD86